MISITLNKTYLIIKKYIFPAPLYIIRKNEDGSFEQKLDWSTPAKLVSFSKIKKYLNLGIESHYFVLM